MIKYVTLCACAECSKSSLIRWVKKYSEDGKIISNHNKTKVSYKVTKEHIEFMNALRLKTIKKNDNKFVSLVELNNILTKKFKDYKLTPRWLGQVHCTKHYVF